VYTVDPKWKGRDSPLSKDKAFINLIFEVPGERLRPVPGGLRRPDGSHEPAAWRLLMRQG